MSTRRLIVAFTLVLASCQNRSAQEQAARIAALEKQNAELKTALNQKTEELTALRQQPAPRPEPAKPAPARPSEPPHHPEDLATLGQVRTQLGDARAMNAELQEKIGKLDSQVLSLMAEREQSTRALTELQEKLATATRNVEAVQKDAKARDERLAQLDQANRKLRGDASTQSQRLTELAQASVEVEDIQRRRENFLTSILRRYREVNDQYRLLGTTLDNRRTPNGAVAQQLDLSRVHDALTMADEDLRQLRALDAQAARAQKKLAAATDRASR